MKKILFILIFILTAISCVAQTGTGWTQMRAKYNFKDTINIIPGWKIGGTIVLPSVTKINSLNGITTVGNAFLSLPNPSAITFPRINADNTVTALSSANYKTALGYLTGSDTTALSTRITNTNTSIPDYTIEKVAGIVYARPNPKTAYLPYSGATFSGVFNSAVNQLPNKGYIFIKGGIYANNDSIVVSYDSIRVRGEGMNNTIIIAKANWDAGKSLAGTEGFFQVLCKDHFYISDLTIDGNGANQTYKDNNNSGDGIVGREHGLNIGVRYGTCTDTAQFAVVENVRIMNFAGAAGLIFRAKNSVVRNSQFINNFSNGITCYGYGNVIENNYVERSADVGVTVIGKNNIVRNNEFSNMSGSYGTTGSFWAIGVEGTGPYILNGNQIIGNKIHSGCRVGIYSYYGAKGTMISVNDISGISTSGGFGISVENGYGQMVTNNNIHDFIVAGSGIVGVADTLTTYSINKVFNLTTANSYGMNFNDTYLSTISNNDIITSGGGAGIILQSAANYNTLTDNRASGVSGIDINASANYNKVLNNVTTGSAGAAFDLVDAGTGTIKNYNYGGTTGGFLTVTVPSPFYLDATSVTATGDDINILSGLSGTISTAELGYSDGLVDNIQDQFNDTLSIQTLAPMLADTIPLFVFGGGGGNTRDTTVFTTSTIYGSFYVSGSDTLVITELRCIMQHGIGTDTLSVDILWDVNLNDATPTELNTNPLGILSITTGTTDTAFANSKIPPGVWVWCETPGVVSARKPTYFNAQISGYKIPKY
jgi:hypothetical protein